MSQRNEAVEMGHITASPDGCDVTAYGQYGERRNRSTSREAPQIGDRSRRIVKNAG